MTAQQGKEIASRFRDLGLFENSALDALRQGNARRAVETARNLRQRSGGSRARLLGQLITQVEAAQNGSVEQVSQGQRIARDFRQRGLFENSALDALRGGQFDRAKTIAENLRQRSGGSRADLLGQLVNRIEQVQGGGSAVTSPQGTPQTVGFFGDVIDTIGGIFGGGGGGFGGGSQFGGSPFQPTPGIGGGTGGPSYGFPTGGGQGGQGGGIIDSLPDSVQQVLESANDIQDLIQNPSVANALQALDPTTANQVLSFFGIDADIQTLRDFLGNPNDGGQGGQGGQQPGFPALPAPPSGGGQGGGQMMPGMGGGLQGNLMMEMLQDSVSGKNAGDVLEAMVSGSLQGGVIQQPQRVPYGSRNEVHHVSPPGFRTIEINGQKVSIFKPLARALGKMPSDGNTELERLDKLAQKFNAARSDLEKLAPKVGLKTSNRKSGPTR